MAAFRPGMPGLFLSLSADASVATSGVVPFNTQDWAEQWPSWAAGVATVPRAGTYLITARWARAAIAATRTETISLRQNGADILTSDRYVNGTAAIRGSLSSLARCEVGDTLSVMYVFSAGASGVFTAGSNNLHIVRVGPDRWTS